MCGTADDRTPNCLCSFFAGKHLETFNVSPKRFNVESNCADEPGLSVMLAQTAARVHLAKDYSPSYQITITAEVFDRSQLSKDKESRGVAFIVDLDGGNDNTHRIVLNNKKRQKKGEYSLTVNGRPFQLPHTASHGEYSIYPIGLPSDYGLGAKVVFHLLQGGGVIQLEMEPATNNLYLITEGELFNSKGACMQCGALVWMDDVEDITYPTVTAATKTTNCAQGAAVQYTMYGNFRCGNDSKLVGPRCREICDKLSDTLEECAPRFPDLYRLQRDMCERNYKAVPSDYQCDHLAEFVARCQRRKGHSSVKMDNWRSTFGCWVDQKTGSQVDPLSCDKLKTGRSTGKTRANGAVDGRCVNMRKCETKERYGRCPALIKAAGKLNTKYTKSCKKILDGYCSTNFKSNEILLSGDSCSDYHVCHKETDSTGNVYYSSRFLKVTCNGNCATINDGDVVFNWDCFAQPFANAQCSCPRNAPGCPIDLYGRAKEDRFCQLTLNRHD